MRQRIGAGEQVKAGLVDRGVDAVGGAAGLAATLAVQVRIFAALILGSRGGGSFVAPSAMLAGIIAVPAATILNRARVRSRNEDPPVWLIASALFNVPVVAATQFDAARDFTTGSRYDALAFPLEST